MGGKKEVRYDPGTGGINPFGDWDPYLNVPVTIPEETGEFKRSRDRGVRKMEAQTAKQLAEEERQSELEKGLSTQNQAEVSFLQSQRRKRGRSLYPSQLGGQ